MKPLLHEGNERRQEATPNPATRKASRVPSRVSGLSALSKTETSGVGVSTPRGHAGRSATRDLQPAAANLSSASVSVSCSTTSTSMSFNSATRCDSCAASFSLVARTRCFLLAAKSARLKAASEKSSALRPVAKETAQAPSTPRSMFICIRLSVAGASTATDGVIYRAADHDEPQIGPLQGGGGDVDRIRRDRQFESSGRQGTSAKLVLPLSRNTNCPGFTTEAARRARACLRSRASSIRAAIGAPAFDSGSAPP